MLAEEIFPLIFIKDRHGSQILNRLKDLFVVHCHWIRLVDHQVIRLPPLLQRAVRFIEQCKDIFFIQQPVQYLLGDIDFINHHIIVIGVLRGDDNAKLIDQRDLGGPHGLHWVAIQCASFVRQEDVCQTAVHAVIGVGQWRVFDFIEQAGDHIPIDLEMLGQGRGDLDNLPHSQPQLRRQLEVRCHGEEPRKARLCQHPQNENHSGVECLEIFSSNLEKRRLVEAPVVFPPPGTEYSYDQEPGIIFKALIHGALQIRVNHQLQQLTYLFV